MGIVNSLENRLRWLAFPSLLRGLAIIHFVMILLLMARPDIGSAMVFDWSKILAGEVWRIVSFLFLAVPAPPVDAPTNFSVFSLLFAFFALMIAFLFNDSLETSWGVWRTSAYFYLVIIGQVVANIILALSGLRPQPEGGMYIYLAAFFAFATLFPKHTFLLMLIIPVQVWILAVISGVFLLLSSLSSLSFSIFVLFTFLPYLWWAVPMALKSGKNRSAVAKRRVAFQSKTKAGQVTSFHRCKICGATENSHPNREFRVASDDEEICSDCLDS
ncbi:MAG: hypothetical protein ACSHYB_02805 [Roseibacillus sp.]